MSGDKPAKSFLARVLEDLAARIEGFPLLSGVISTASGAVDLVADGLGKAGESLGNAVHHVRSDISRSFSISHYPTSHESAIISAPSVPRMEETITPSRSMDDMLPTHAKEQVQGLSSALNHAHVGYAGQSMNMSMLNALSPSPVPNLRQRGGVAQGMA
jgi:hypothetical protein